MAEIVVGVIGALIAGLLGREFSGTGRRVLAWRGIKSNVCRYPRWSLLLDHSRISTAGSWSRPMAADASLKPL